MIHVYQHHSKKYDIAIVENGKYIVGSEQGYNNIQGCYRAIRAVMKNFPSADHAIFQNDVKEKSEVFMLPKIGQPSPLSIKPKKKYIPKK